MGALCKQGYIVRYLTFAGALLFVFCATTCPLDQIVTTPGHLGKVSRDTLVDIILLHRQRQ